MKPFIDPTAGELVVSWEQYHALIEHLALLIHDRGCPFDQVVALSRGGLRVGDVISRLFNRPLVVMAVSSYGGANGREQGGVRVGQNLAHTCPRLGATCCWWMIWRIRAPRWGRQPHGCAGPSNRIPSPPLCSG